PFGCNWDTLLEMFCDFSWIKQETILIIHDELPLLEDSDLSVYLEILNISIEFWENWEGDNKHFLIIVFPKQFESIAQ
ncbi:MAG: hypothetical protein LIO93_02920, partial [Bacteroidales bacterium]|nr:hypothetical protein [Bacteroidales bacterium]